MQLRQFLLKRLDTVSFYDASLLFSLNCRSMCVKLLTMVKCSLKRSKRARNAQRPNPSRRPLFSKSFHNLSGRLRVTTQVRSIESLKEDPSCMRIDPYKRCRRFPNRRLLQGYDCLPQESTKYFKLIVDGSACIRKICCNNLTDFPKRMSS